MKYIIHIIRIVFLALFLFLLANGKAMLWLVLFGLSLLVALVFGRVYCGYVCPMNTLMLPIEWLSKKLKLQSQESPKWLKKGYFAWISLAVSIAVMILSRKLFKINLPILPFWLIVSVFITLKYKPDVFHNLICPFGPIQRIFSRFARYSEKVDKDACVGCKLCEKACPSRAIAVSSESKKAYINKTLCFQCTSCQQVCPKNAIQYAKYEDIKDKTLSAKSE